MLPLKFLTAQHVTDGPHETPEFIDEGVPFLSVDGIQNNQLVFEGCRYISSEDHARYSIKCKPNQGDVLLGKAASVGKVAHVDTDIEFNVWSPLAVIRPRSKKTGRFIYYSLQSALLQMQCDMYSNANTQKNLGMSTIDNFAFASPTDDEAEQIAYFLDHETAKIDALIEKQQRLIELLKEKRQAVISHAVTKGLNPNAPMKDSGVEWLGEVPAHWVTKRLKHISPKIGVGLVINPSTYTRDEGVYFIFGGDVKEYGFDLSNTRRMSLQDSNSLLPSRLNHRDLVCVRVGYPGITAVVTEELTGSNCASVVVVRRGEFNSDWLCAAMNTWIGRQQVELCSYGAAQKQFNVADAIDFLFPVPPPHEQDALADYVAKKLVRFNVLISKAEVQISLLQERRTALISAAVTGKIDVRDCQAAA
jgi:type I restriction enzyme S subunit